MVNGSDCCKLSEQWQPWLVLNNECQKTLISATEKEQSLKFIGILFRSSHRKYSLKKGVLNNFGKFTGTQLDSCFISKII